MELSQSKRPWEWMVKPTAQKQWIEGRGVLLWLAMFFGFGAGLYLVAMPFNSLWGMFIGWLIVIFGYGGLHFAFLGRPLRFWRMMMRPQTSWISRGLIFAVIFIGAGAIQMALIYWQVAPVAQVIFGVIAGIFAFLLSIYLGFVMNSLRALPFWNSGLLPVLVVASELLGGFSIALAIALTIDPVFNIAVLELGIRILLTVVALLLVVYVWSATEAPTGGKEAVIALTRGPVSYSLPFWVALVGIGIITPIIIAWYPWSGELSHSLLFVATGCEFIGGLSLRYCMLRAGIYAPLLPIR